MPSDAPPYLAMNAKIARFMYVASNTPRYEQIEVVDREPRDRPEGARLQRCYDVLVRAGGPDWHVGHEQPTRRARPASAASGSGEHYHRAAPPVAPSGWHQAIHAAMDAPRTAL